MRSIVGAVIIFAASMLLGACVGVPEGIKPVSDFKLDRYLGTWYEVARLDHRFERGMSHVTANYSMRDDGGVAVVNRGYVADKQEWKTAEGKAYFVDDTDVGQLKVSFFGPFYGGYNIVDLDQENYQYSLVVGPNRDYLWILSRTPEMDAETLARLVATAESMEFPVEDLIYVDQQGQP